MAAEDLPPDTVLPILGDVPLKYFTGASKITSGELSCLLNRLAQEAAFLSESGARSWPVQTNNAVEWAAGFYKFAGSVNDFSPSITFGAVNEARGAHLSIVTGAVAATEIQITVTGTSITDSAVRTEADSEVITIPAGTPANSYFETPKKWNGQTTLETTSGTPISCDYFWSKYHDMGNSDFRLIGLEALWSSDDNGGGSNIELLHHKATGWTYGAGGVPTLPTAIASRSVDYGTENAHAAGPGTWKRADLDVAINGADSEGFLFRVTSGSTGLGSLSFRILNIEVVLRKTIPPALP